MRFIDNQDGTITDTSTGLMWQKATAPGHYTWDQAIEYCKSLDLAGYNDWRLPTIQELFSIVDFSRFNPAIDPIFECLAFFYWSTTHAYDIDCAWGVDFYVGDANYDDKDSCRHRYVRAVRGGNLEAK